MSNDTRYWIERIVAVLIFLVGTSAMFRMSGAAIQGKTGSMIGWGIVFVLMIIAGMVQYIRYRLAKARRWEASHDRDQASVEVEILAAHAKAEREAKEKQSGRVN